MNQFYKTYIAKDKKDSRKIRKIFTNMASSLSVSAILKVKEELWGGFLPYLMVIFLLYIDIPL